MRDLRMGKFVILPFSAGGCVSRSSVAVAENQHKRSPSDPPPQETTPTGGGELEQQSTGKKKTKTKTKRPNKIQKLIKSLSHLFAAHDEEEEEEVEMEIGLPTDVKHVAHFGWDGHNTISSDTDMKSWLKGSELLPLNSLSLKQFEAAMETLAGAAPPPPTPPPRGPPRARPL